MIKKLNNYWVFQAVGWTFFFIFNTLVYTAISKPDLLFFKGLITFTLIGVAITHSMRLSILKLKVLERPLLRQIGILVVLSILFAGAMGLLNHIVDENFFVRNVEEDQKYTNAQKILFHILNAFWILFLWNMIYFFYHVLENNRRQQMDKLKLSAEVKNMELKTIKATINPHFIFNALNSIRALVDEDPHAARNAITMLSNLLRSSLNAQHRETVPLSEELSIVKDYLALEKVRFEERLNVEFDVEDDTLPLGIPPMMLQTLVENAIKHGISKRVEGGFVKISSRLVNGEHLLTVTNSGRLENAVSPTGFGLRSTADRLNILYNGKAHFEIKSIFENEVESRVSLPLAFTQ